MKKKLIALIFMVFTYSTTQTRTMDPDLQFVDQIVLTGSIQFPRAIECVPDIRIYYAGNKLKGERDDAIKKSIFTIPINKNTTIFYLLVCEHISAHTQDNFKNLVRYLKIEHHTPYKLYRMELVSQAAKNSNPIPTNTRDWRISRVALGKDGRIPDDAIIICYNPKFIESIEPLSAVELPIIKIRSDLLEHIGSQDALDQYSLELIMASLDMDLIHATIQPDLKKNYEKTIVAMITR